MFLHEAGISVKAIRNFLKQSPPSNHSLPPCRLPPTSTTPAIGRPPLPRWPGDPGGRLPYVSQPANHAKRSKQSNQFFTWIGLCAISVILHFPATTVLLNESLDRVSVEKQSHADLKSPMMKWRLGFFVLLNKGQRWQSILILRIRIQAPLLSAMAGF